MALSNSKYVKQGKILQHHEKQYAKISADSMLTADITMCPDFKNILYNPINFV